MKILTLIALLMNVLNKNGRSDVAQHSDTDLLHPCITAGAALTSMHYVALKIVRNEESLYYQKLFKSFKTNFRQATLIWLTILLIADPWRRLLHYYQIRNAVQSGVGGTDHGSRSAGDLHDFVCISGTLPNSTIQSWEPSEMHLS